MFSFFTEVSDFCSQIARLFNWALHFVVSLLSASTDVVAVFNDFSAELPVQVSWILPLTFMVYGFHFIRGHW